MAVMLQTGNTGMPVTSASDGILYSSIVGTGSYVMDVGSRLSATMADANTLIVNDGSVMHNGRHILMEGATRFTIPSGQQGMRRAHIAVIRTTKDEDGAERSDAVVVSGEPVASGTPPDPDWHRESLLDDATISDMPLYRVVTDGINAGDPVRLFGYHTGSLHEMDMDNATGGVLAPARGGTGVTSAARIGLMAYPVNAIYPSRAAANPAALFGGTWAEITDSKLFLGIYLYRRTA